MGNWSDVYYLKSCNGLWGLGEICNRKITLKYGLGVGYRLLAWKHSETRASPGRKQVINIRVWRNGLINQKRTAERIWVKFSKHLDSRLLILPPNRCNALAVFGCEKNVFANNLIIKRRKFLFFQGHKTWLILDLLVNKDSNSDDE